LSKLTLDSNQLNGCVSRNIVNVPEFNSDLSSCP
jgi:hypothetical protein